ncbi:methyl-accepting chemotaxis protein [Sphingosinithalassobacter sp. LHW66-3]|uniref:methyl-accepting chemotaxis protein n=1 Tax=Sphingosinithalassobacter sp. LHW66-3 TaxID=3424718 RepID=UPI003D6AA671
MTNALSLDHLRLLGMRTIAAIMVALALATAAGSASSGFAQGALPVILAFVLPIYPVLLALRGAFDANARLIATMTVVAQPALMLYVFEGAAWQVDLHMIFFAALAVTALLCDWRALVGGAAVVAVHHLLLGMLVPEWVFLGGGGIGRILLHAVVLIVETGALVLLAQSIVGLLAKVSQEADARIAADAAAQAERAERAAELERVVASVSGSLEAMARGDLTREIRESFPAAYAALKANCNATAQSLRQLIGSVGEGARQIGTGSTEIANAAEQQARRIERTAANLEETSVAVASIDERLQALAQTAEGSLACADAATGSVESGRARALHAVETMGRVRQSAEGIDDVIEGLDKIAFQTRVLAMNAAVEAGRAGEAGRGFAVVADLVSALAMRAEEEAKRAREQLTVTQDEVAGAVGAVEEVDSALTAIAETVEKVHALLSTTAGENQAQAQAIREIRSAIGEMEIGAQQDAAMVEQTSAAARELLGQVQALTESTAQFSVEEARIERQWTGSASVH